jgi:hypothetical protein
MKKILPALFSAFVIMILACNKNSSTGGTTNGGNNGSGGNNGGNNNSGLTITSISPVNPYPDDEIAINGTGFNADATKDTVEFGRMISSNGFGAWHDGTPDQWASLATVISATTTKLVIKSVNPFPLDYNSFNYGGAFSDGKPSIAVVQVRVGSNKVVSPVIPFKRLLVVGWIKNPDYNGAAIGRPNDSLIIGGEGFSKNGVTVSIGGKLIPAIKIDSGSNSGQLMFRLSKDFFGGVNDEKLMETRTVSVTNADGKTIKKDFSFLLSPKMVISSMKSEQNSYSLSALNTNGGSVIITIKGKCLKDDAYFTIGNSDQHTLTTHPLPVTAFQDAISIELSSTSLKTGHYGIRVWRDVSGVGKVLYGGCDFVVTQ